MIYRRPRRLVLPPWVLPAMLISICIWLFVGCIYLPVPEHRVSQKEFDFRGILGPAGSKKPVRPGVTWASIEQILGPAPFASEDGQSRGYTLETVRAVWFYPLCLGAGDATYRDYLLRLDFDRDQVLVNWRLTHADDTEIIPVPSAVRYGFIPGIPNQLQKGGPILYQQFNIHSIARAGSRPSWPSNAPVRPLPYPLWSPQAPQPTPRPAASRPVQ